MSHEFKLWEGRTYQIVRYYVIDGDTIDAEVKQEYPPRRRHRIRLHGIDTPEITQPHGPDAAQHLRNLLRANPSPLYAYITDASDRYGRAVAILHQSNIFESVNAQMVQDGLAYAYYSDDYQRAESRARQNSAGIWENINGSMRPWEYRRAQQQQPAQKPDPKPQRTRLPDPPYPTPSRPPTRPLNPRQRPRPGATPTPTPTPTPTLGKGCATAICVILAIVAILIMAGTCGAGPGPAEAGDFTGASPKKAPAVALATGKGDAIQQQVGAPRHKANPAFATHTRPPRPGSATDNPASQTAEGGRQLFASARIRTRTAFIATTATLP